MLVMTWIGWAIAALLLVALVGAVIAPLLASGDDGLVDTGAAPARLESIEDLATDDEAYWRAVIQLRLILHERERRGVDTAAAREALLRMCQAFERAGAPAQRVYVRRRAMEVTA